MALTAFRAIRLRMSGQRISIVESMLQDGIYYFSKRLLSSPQVVHVIVNEQITAVIVFGLNISLVITFATVKCAIQLIFQRMTQVLTVVMISHMYLNLKSNPETQKRNEGNHMASGSLVDKGCIYPAPASLDTWFIAPEKISSVVGTLGNDLVHTSLLDY